ncbi:PP2C family protein-serine/threonine phosphatase [Euzebya tangerina]|uniref:PP2C family protein-serine/threonine phosphatase n=1 Tax=Euzebya tangerina TaxID=591198 RepID=UPI0013C2A7CA|nr:PP2C family protein-serine/threonine phosphatase [Euzebya tangerina]
MTAIQQESDPDVMLGQLLTTALRSSGATSAAVLERGVGETLRPVQEVCSVHGAVTATSTLPSQIGIGDLRSPLWTVLLGRATLRWTTPEEGPAPMSQTSGWHSGVVLRMNARRGATRVLALGGLPESEEPDIALLQGLGDVVAGSLAGLELTRAAERSDAVLTTITDLAGELGAAVSPQQLLVAITRGLSELESVDGARIWEVTATGEPRLVAGEYDGDLPGSELTERRLEGLASPDVTPSVRALLEAESRGYKDGPLVTLAVLTSEPTRVLGIAHAEPLDDLSRSVVRSLIGAIEPAMRKVGLAAERRSLLSRYTESLMPRGRPGDLDIAVELHANTRATGSFGGDFYDWFELPDGRAAVALGDVAGKGLVAAGASSMAVWSLRALVSGTLGMADLVETLDRVVQDQLDSERFVTLALVAVDPTTWHVELVLSGHPPPIVVGGGAGHPVEAAPTPPLGLIGRPIDEVTSFSLEPGEMLVLYTDGVTDATAENNQRYGAERVLSNAARLSATPGISAEELAAELWFSVQTWAGGAPDDDCALLVVARPA